MRAPPIDREVRPTDRDPEAMASCIKKKEGLYRFSTWQSVGNGGLDPCGSPYLATGNAPYESFNPYPLRTNRKTEGLHHRGLFK